METNDSILTLTEEEKLILIPLLPQEKALNLQKQSGGLYTLTIDDGSAETLSEKVRSAYVAEGFNVHYELTPKGKILEALVDKFTDIGF